MNSGPPARESSVSAHQIEAIRVPRESIYRWLLLASGVISLSVPIVAAAYLHEPRILVGEMALLLCYIVLDWFSWTFYYWRLYGHAVRVSSSQYPHIYRVVEEASMRLRLPVVPTILIAQGEGTHEFRLAKRFSRPALFSYPRSLLMTSPLPVTHVA